jgi:integrase/recombinase XerD
MSSVTVNPIPSIQIFTRHSEDCPYRGDEAHKKCKCPKHLRWSHGGRQHRQSAKTRSWSAAEEVRRSVEDKFRSGSGQPVRIATEAKKTLADAIRLYIQHKKNEGIKHKAAKSYESQLGRLEQFMSQRQIYFPADMRKEDLIEFQAAWDTYKSTQTRARATTRLRGFLNFAHESGWIDKVPKLSRVKIDEPPTLPLSTEEYQKLLDTIPSTFKPEKAARVRTLVQLMRYSGLAIRDAVTLERRELVWDEVRKLYRVTTKRTKTGTDVSVIIPPAVSAELLAVHNDHPDYFFWNTGKGKESSAVTNWSHDLRTLFRAAGFPEGHSHQLRDSFAVALLEKGVPIEEVSKLLGHESIKTTEKHYAPWVQSRQDRLDSLVTATF